MIDKIIQKDIAFLRKRLNFGYKMPHNRPLPEIMENIKHNLKECDTFCNNRLLMGDFRYGVIDRQNFDDYDLKAECIKRLSLNTMEGVIDGINMLRLYFYWQRKKGRPFISIDDGEHTEKIKEK